MDQPPRGVRVPGKLVLVGEYAVLTPGEPAIVAAVDRYAVGGAAGFDTRAFHDRSTGRKLGLGSSAAVAVGRAALAEGTADRHRLLARARAEHEAMGQTGGSGVDLAASVFGGLLLYRRGEPPEALPIPEGLSLVVGWTGVEARTPGFTAAVRAAFAVRPDDRSRFLDRSRRAVERFREGLVRGNELSIREGLAGGLVAMRFLATATGLALFTPEVESLIEGAASCGVVAKPSGAGGGDCGIVVTLDGPGAVGLTEAWRGRGIEPLDLAIPPGGVSQE